MEDCDGDGEGPPQEQDDESSKVRPIDVQMSVRRQSLTKRDVLLLLDPTAAACSKRRVENSKKVSIDKKSVGWRSSSVVESDDEGSQQQEKEDNCGDAAAEEDSEAAHAKDISTEDIHSSCTSVDNVIAQTVQELSAQVRIGTYGSLIFLNNSCPHSLSR